MGRNTEDFTEGTQPESYLVGYALRHGRITPEEAADLHPDYPMTDPSDIREIKFKKGKK